MGRRATAAGNVLRSEKLCALTTQHSALKSFTDFCERRRKAEGEERKLRSIRFFRAGKGIKCLHKKKQETISMGEFAIVRKKLQAITYAAV